MLTPDQQRAVDSDATRICVQASAGSGKTRVLIERMLRLVRDKRDGGKGVPIERIVAITFTEKAASEIRSRLGEAFREASERESERDRFQFWRTLELHADLARANTIHGFCSSILREHALRIGLDPGYTILEEAEALRIRERTIASLLEARLATHDPAATMLYAEYGYRGCMELLARLARSDAFPELARAYTRDDSLASWADARENRRRSIRPQILAAVRSDRAFGTARQELEIVYREHTKPDDERVQQVAVAIDCLQQLDATDDVDTVLPKLRDIAAFGFRKKCAKAWTSKSAMEHAKTLLDGVRSMVRNLLDLLEIDPAVEARAAVLEHAIASLAGPVSHALDEAFAAAQSLDFDALLRRTLAVLRDDRGLCETVAMGIGHLLIDEFQDTDGKQLEIAEALADANPNLHVLVVGDPKQSIYRFRGAEVEVFRRYRTTTERNGDVIDLAKNFRSVAPVLAFVNETFTRSGLLDATERYEPMQAHRASASQTCIEFLTPAVAEGTSTEDARRTEASLIAKRIVAWCAASESDAPRLPGPEGTSRPPGFGDIAILLRAMSDAHLYEDALREAGVPFVQQAGATFYARQEIYDFANLLRATADPYDEFSLAGFLRGPAAACSDAALYTLAEHEGGLAAAFADARCGLDDPGDHRALQCARTLIDGLRAASNRSLGAWVRLALDRSGLEAVWLQQYAGLQRLLNVRKLVELADRHEGSGGGMRTFAAVLEDAQARDFRDSEAPVPAGDAGAVRLMTIHASKGLEFPIVVLADIGRAPRSRTDGPVAWNADVGLGLRFAGEDDKRQQCAISRFLAEADRQGDRAENGRLLYVAMTRARDYLALAGAVVKHGKKSTNRKSKDPAWLDTLQEVYGLPLPDGSVHSGKGWAARVVSAIAQPIAMGNDPADESTRSAPEQDPGSVLAGKYVGPVQTDAKPSPIVSISSLLDGIATVDPDDVDSEPYQGGGEHEVRDSAFPRLRGDLIHRFLQTWDFRSPVSGIALPQLGWLSEADADRIRASIQAVAEILLDSDRISLLQGPSLRREWPFVWPLESHLLTGTIDVLTENGDLIDYKTGQPKPSTEARYRKQLALYAAAYAAIERRPATSAWICYVDVPAWIQVDIDSESVRNVTSEAIRALALEASVR